MIQMNSKQQQVDKEEKMTMKNITGYQEILKEKKKP